MRKNTCGGITPITYATYPFKFGFLRIGYTDNTVFSLEKTNTPDSLSFPTEFTDMVFNQISEYLGGNRRKFTFPFKLSGTEFQKKVWMELCNIPYGQTRSYKDIAKAIGNPKACRAVGNANNKNPLIIVVPCHRVIGTNGKLTGYGAGLEMKEALLQLENRFIETSF